jgi:hypothetical protein
MAADADRANRGRMQVSAIGTCVAVVVAAASMIAPRAFGEGSPERVKSLVKGLRGSNCDRQRKAAAELAALGAEAMPAAADLVSLMHRVLAADCFSDCGAIEARHALVAIGEPAVPAILKGMAPDECGMIATTLGLMGEVAAARLADILADPHEPASRRSVAASALGDMASRHEMRVAIGKLMWAFLKALESEDPEILTPTILALKALPEKATAATPRLRVLADREDAEGTASAARDLLRLIRAASDGPQ